MTAVIDVLREEKAWQKHKQLPYKPKRYWWRVGRKLFCKITSDFVAYINLDGCNWWVDKLTTTNVEKHIVAAVLHSSGPAMTIKEAKQFSVQSVDDEI